MRKIMVVSCLLLIVGLLVGCGERTETARYYFSPSWTNDGRIIFIGVTDSVRKDILGGQLGSSYSQYALTIYPTGTGESSSLFDLSSSTPYAMSCSPGVNYVAFMDDLRSGLFRKIIIRNIALGQHTNLEVAELIFSPGIKSFDWSNDGTRIVYCTTQEVRIRNWNDNLGTTDTLVTAEADLEFVSWQNGGRIACVSSSEGTFLINPGSGARQALVGAGVVVDKPQISATDTNQIYGIMGGSYVRVNAGSGATTEVVANFKGDLPRLFSDGKQLVYSKRDESSGIYLISDITASSPAETKLK